MFARVLSATALLLALPLLAVATPAGMVESRQVPAGAMPASQCNTGSLQCCQQTQAPDNAQLASLIGSLLSIPIGSVDAFIGVQCSPISVIGVGSGSSCNANPSCCTNNEVGGLAGIGCVPVNLAL